MIVSARLTTSDAAPVLLRLDSGSNTPVLFAARPQLLKVFASRLQCSNAWSTVWHSHLLFYRPGHPRGGMSGETCVIRNTHE